jgi:AcrR family transcriptional regulator
MSSAAVKPAPRLKTRARILDICRDLFNERGPDSVTTAEIAAAAGINEGNLYYHFQRKEQLLEALFAAFEAAIRDAAAAPAAAPESTRAYLAGWFRTMWEWRFFYRDGTAIFRLAPALRPRLHTLSTEGQALVAASVCQMQEAGLISPMSQAELAMLITNAWIVSAYWIDYLRAGRGVADITRAHIAWGAQQVMHLFQPYLTAEGQRFAALDLPAA